MDGQLSPHTYARRSHQAAAAAGVGAWDWVRAMRLALHIWSESLRDPALTEFVVRTYGRLKAILVIVARRARDHGDLPPDADPRPSALSCSE